MDKKTVKKKTAKPKSRIGIASRESFPASDPPSYWAAPPASDKPDKDKTQSDKKET